MQENAHCRLKNAVAVDTVETMKHEAGREARKRRQHTGTRRGRCRLFEHMRDQGEQVETLWESGKTIRHLTREEGQVT